MSDAKRSDKRWRSRRKLPLVAGNYFPAKQIVPGLWIGSEGDSQNARFISRNDIGLIVNATANIPFQNFGEDVDTYRIPVNDNPMENETMLKHFPVVVLAIDDVLEHGNSVLVHCRAGMQRSAATVAAYLMWKRGMTANQAFEFINKKKHETFWPVATFEPALRAWESMLTTKRAT